MTHCAGETEEGGLKGWRVVFYAHNIIIGNERIFSSLENNVLSAKVTNNVDGVTQRVWQLQSVAAAVDVETTSAADLKPAGSLAEDSDQKTCGKISEVLLKLLDSVLTRITFT